MYIIVDRIFTDASIFLLLSVLFEILQSIDTFNNLFLF